MGQRPSGTKGAKAVSMPNMPTLVITAVPNGSLGRPCFGRCTCSSLDSRSISLSRGLRIQNGVLWNSPRDRSKDSSLPVRMPFALPSTACTSSGRPRRSTPSIRAPERSLPESVATETKRSTEWRCSSRPPQRTLAFKCGCFAKARAAARVTTWVIVRRTPVCSR